MKKRTIVIIAIIMGMSFTALLILQLTYMRAMAQMKREQFDESVNRALYQAARNVELNETLRYLEKDLSAQQNTQDSTLSDKASAATHSTNIASQPSYHTFEWRTRTAHPAAMPKGIILNSDRRAAAETSRSMQAMLHNRYLYQKALVDEVVYRLLDTAAAQPLEERINFKQLDQDIKAELLNNGLNIPYHFLVSTADGREVYRCPDYTVSKNSVAYSQLLFRNDAPSQIAVIKVHFAGMGDYIFDSVKFVIPSIVFTIILLVTFIFTIVVAFRQKRLSEMRNDFINNMTHELKTPISSISLAAQMLTDKSIPKTETRMAHLAGIVADEARRLRFLVDRVLQMSLLDRQKTIYNLKEIDINEMVDGVANTFLLRVQHTGGHITTTINANKAMVSADEMHLQNVFFNLLDNAVKYRKNDTPLEVNVKTWNSDEQHVAVRIADNGQGIKRESMKKIFDKFYRVPRGNLHDVKGFGLGLAYVKQIVTSLNGDIHAESEQGRGTTFTITLPVVVQDA